jgi:hypothetical protein
MMRLAPPLSRHPSALTLLVACLACGKTTHGGHDAGAGAAAADAAREAQPPSDLEGDAPSTEGGSPADVTGAAADAAGEGARDTGAADAGADATAEAADATDAADDADDPRCADAPGPGACLCDGFAMANPAGASLPNPARYEAVGADEVLDDVTGLVWERSPTVDHFTQADGVAHCLAATTGGHGPWRLPTAVELASIHDFTSKVGLASPFPADPFGEVWSSTLLTSVATETGFVVAFNSQYDEAALVHSTDHIPVRCVRTGM